MRQTLPKSSILRGYQSFSRVISQGISIQSNSLLCHCLAQPSSKPRVWIGFSVPKKLVPQAVKRNRLKRLMREAVRKHYWEVQQWADQKQLSIQLVVSCRRKQEQEITKASLREIESEWIDIQRQLLTQV